MGHFTMVFHGAPLASCVGFLVGFGVFFFFWYLVHPISEIIRFHEVECICFPENERNFTIISIVLDPNNLK